MLNETDSQRAEIVRRYRLYSYQPDEMITFNALRQMKPGAGQLDPKLYQYGGLWVYPVGAMLKVEGFAAKNGKEFANATNITMPDGTKIFAGADEPGK